MKGFDAIQSKILSANRFINICGQYVSFYAKCLPFTTWLQKAFQLSGKEVDHFIAMFMNAIRPWLDATLYLHLYMILITGLHGEREMRHVSC